MECLGIRHISSDNYYFEQFSLWTILKNIEQFLRILIKKLFKKLEQFWLQIGTFCYDNLKNPLECMHKSFNLLTRLCQWQTRYLSVKKINKKIEQILFLKQWSVVTFENSKYAIHRENII